MQNVQRLGPLAADASPAPGAGVAAPAEPSVVAFREMASSLLSLVMLTHKEALAGLLRKALLELNDTMPFSSAWWGELSAAGGVGRRARVWMHGNIGLSESFAEELNEIISLNGFGAQSIAHPGAVVWSNRAPPTGEPDSACDRFGRRHGLHHAMAITLDLPLSGLHFVVALYRHPGLEGFRALDAARFEAYAKHLAQLWRGRLERLHGPLHAWETSALADAHGKLLYLGRRVAQAIGRAHPQWAGPMLPARLVRAASEGRRLVSLGKSDRLVVQVHPEVISVSLQRGKAGAALPRRELNVATLYAQGHTSTRIAEMLGLSPATVRTYLQGAYGHLGVRNKIELVAALGMGERI